MMGISIARGHGEISFGYIFLKPQQLKSVKFLITLICTFHLLGAFFVFSSMKEKFPTKLKHLCGPLTLKQRRCRYHRVIP